MKVKCLIALAVAAALVGCSSSRMDWQAPARNEVPQTKVSDASFDRFWNRYVEDLSQSFFSINNISKESRIINVSFSTSEPGEYVDCGAATRSWAGGYVPAGSITYNPADSVDYYEQRPGTMVLLEVSHRTRLEGRFNVYIAPKGSRTQVRATARYSLIVDITKSDNQLYNQNKNYVVTLDSNSAAYPSFGEEQFVECVSTGKLEEALLSLGV